MSIAAGVKSGAGNCTLIHQTRGVVGAPLLAKADNGFTTILAGRNALNVASQVLEGETGNDCSAPAASEFAAVALFRACAGSERAEGGDPASVQALAAGQDAGIESEGSGTVEAGLGPDLSAFGVTVAASEVLPSELPYVAPETVSSPRSVVRDRGQAPEFAPVIESQATAHIVHDETAGSFDCPDSIGAADDLNRPAATTSRAILRETAPPVVLGLFADGAEVEVHARLANLTLEQAGELDRRIHDVLYAARLGARHIRLNGRQVQSAERN